MDRKIIIKMEDLTKEIYSFLAEVGAGMPMDWNTEALDHVRNAAIEAYENMGVTLEIDERSQSHLSSFPQQPQVGGISNHIVKKKGGQDSLVISAVSPK
jgi:hypothetical protein